MIFQSTLPVWGATSERCTAIFTANISIHAPRVGSDLVIVHGLLTDICISIHAPRVGSDSRGSTGRTTNRPFQSTLPVWGATQALRNLCITLCISIHAPRVGSDLCRANSFA